MPTTGVEVQQFAVGLLVAHQTPALGSCSVWLPTAHSCALPKLRLQMKAVSTEVSGTSTESWGRDGEERLPAAPLLTGEGHKGPAPGP